MFRIRRGVFGSSVLQVSDVSGEGWRDVKPSPFLLDGFHIISVGTLNEMTARIAIAERRAATARRSRRKKVGLLVTEIPILTQKVYP